MRGKMAARLASILLAACSIGHGDEPQAPGVAKPRRTFRLESSEVLLGEPILVEFRVEMEGPGVWAEPVSGSSRGMGRLGEGVFLMRHEDGSWVPDTFEGIERMSLGGTGGTAEVKQGQPHSRWLAVQQWCAIERPGVYQLYAFGWGPDTLPKVGDSIPAEVKAKHRTAERACDFAQFRLTVRQGDDRQRRAMVQRWIRRPDVEDDPGFERYTAARTAMALARQDDFLPELSRRLREEDRTLQNVVYMGLAMRDDPRAVDLLFEGGDSRTIEAMSLLRPKQVPAAIPRLIDRLIDDDDSTRATAEEVLRRWTGQEFGHSWDGYNWKRPTLEEGRAMQPTYRAWWMKNKERFTPRLR
jgi:hypothetical protein